MRTSVTIRLTASLLKRTTSRGQVCAVPDSGEAWRTTSFPSKVILAAVGQCKLDELRTFRLFIKPFVEATTWAAASTDRCCGRVIHPYGKLDSLSCRYSGIADFP